MDTLANPVNATDGTHPFDFNDLFSKCDLMMKQYWDDNPDLYQIIQQKKQETESTSSKEVPSDCDSQSNLTKQADANTTMDTSKTPFFGRPLRGALLALP